MVQKTNDTIVYQDLLSSELMVNICKLYCNDGATGTKVIFEDPERLQRSHVVLEELLRQVLPFAATGHQGHQGQETHPLGVAQLRMLPRIALVSAWCHLFSWGKIWQDGEQGEGIFQDMKG